MSDPWKRLAQQAAEDYPLFVLRAIIITWSLMIIVLALIIKNKLLLGLILAYEVLP